MNILKTVFTNFFPVICIIALLMISVAIASKKKLGTKTNSPIKAKSPVTKNEQPMFFRLVESFPNDIVLAQVAFSALLQTKDRTTRNRFDRKVTDFVICTKAFKVRAIIELDDLSHNGREEQDKNRISLLTDAGYKVLRYKQVPNIETLQKDLQIMSNADIEKNKPTAQKKDTYRFEPK